MVATSTTDYYPFTHPFTSTIFKQETEDKTNGNVLWRMRLFGVVKVMKAGGLAISWKDS
jgi:hypothetical protein